MRKPILLVGAALAMWQAPVRAQTDTANDAVGTRTVAAQQMIDKTESGVANGVSGQALVASRIPQLQLLATADEKLASLTWSFAGSTHGGTGGIGFDQFTLKVSTALDSSKSNTSLFSLDGFPGGTELKLNYTHFSGGYVPVTTEQEQDNVGHIRQAEEACERDHPGAKATVLDTKCHPESRTFEGSTSDLLLKYDKPAADAFYRDHFAGYFTFWGVEAGANQDSYSYLDRAAFKTASTSKFGYSGTAFIGLLSTRQDLSITGSFTYARQYRKQDDVTLCQAVNASQTQCLTGADGAPEAKRKAIVALDLRYAFGILNGAPQYAIAPQVSYDAQNNVYSLDLPIYLASDGQGKLRAGVRGGYINEPKKGGGRSGHFSLGVFVGVPFSLLGR